MKFKSMTEWLNEANNTKTPTYGCVMMGTKIQNWEEYHLAGIDESDIYIKPYDKSYGLENDSHVTVLYGIHEDEIDDETIANIIRENMKPLTLRVDEIDIFENPEMDIVKYNLSITAQLMKYRKLFLKFPNTQKFDYNPHMTIAYLKPGTGKKYKRKLREPFEVTFTKGIYSYHDTYNTEEIIKKIINLENDIISKS